MNRRSRLLMIAAITVMALTAAGIAALLLQTYARPPASSTWSGAPIGGPFSLTASSGDTVTDRSYRGKWLLVYFGYTHCPDVCPTVLNNIGVALRVLGPEAAQVQPLFITVDPERDTAKVLAQYLEAFDPQIVGLTGTDQQIAAVAREYGVYFSSHQTAAQKDYLVDHSALTYVMNPQGKFAQVVLGPDLSGEAMAARLRPLLTQGG